MNTVISRPAWRRKASYYDPRMSESYRQSLLSIDKLSMTMLRLGLLLLLALVLFGCGTPVVVRESCPEYPQMPESLRNYQSKNLDLVPSESLPPKSAKPASIGPQKTQ